MKFTATAHKVGVLEGISAASAVEIAGGRMFVVGDDSAFLYLVDPCTFCVLERIPIARVPDDGTGEHISKRVKPDFECLTQLPSSDGLLRLSAIGSGSKITGIRDSFAVVTLSADTTVCSTEQLSAGRLFDILRGDLAVLGSAKLNLEGATLLADNKLVLMQRGNVSGVNSVLTMDATFIEEALRNEDKPLPGYNIAYLELPQLDGWDAGLSGVTTCVLPEKEISGVTREHLLFSASYEATRSEIDDGDCLGSLIGLLPSTALTSATPKSKLAPMTALVRGTTGEAFQGKIEGVTLLKEPVLSAGGTILMEAFAVTDPDGAASQYVLLTLELIL